MSGDTIETIVGHVPASWPIHTLESLAVFITKGGTPTTYGHDWADASTGIPFFRSECVTDNGFDSKGMNFISPAAHQQMVRSEVKPGDLLMTITGNVGRVAKAPEEFATANINQHIARIRVLGTPDADADFVYHCLKHDGYAAHYRSILTGQAYPQISLQQVRETPVALPPVAERRKIAAILTAVDDKLAVIARQIKITRTVKRGLIQTLFSRGIGSKSADGRWTRHTAFVKVGSAEYPKSWRMERMGDFAPLVRREVDVEPGENYPELGLRSFGKGTFHKPALTGEQVGSKRLFLIKAGDLLLSNVFAWEGAVAVAGPADDGRYGSHRYITCKVDPDIANVHFVARYLVTPAGLASIGIASPGGAGRNKTLGLAALADIQIPLPPLAEQNAINEVLECVEAKIASLQAKHKLHRDLKRGLMQKLLTGEWLVNVDAKIAA